MTTGTSPEYQIDSRVLSASLRFIAMSRRRLSIWCSWCAGTESGSVFYRGDPLNVADADWLVDLAQHLRDKHLTKIGV